MVKEIAIIICKNKKIVIMTNSENLIPVIEYDKIIISKIIEVETLKGKIDREKILYKNF